MANNTTRRSKRLDTANKYSSQALVLSAVAMAIGLASQPTLAASVTVDQSSDNILANTDDDGRCNLREAITSVNTNNTSPTLNGGPYTGGTYVTGCVSSGSGAIDTVEFSRDLTARMNTGPNGFALLEPISINPAGRNITINANAQSRIFTIVGADTNVRLNKLTLTNGFLDLPNTNVDYGSAIASFGGTLTITDSTIVNNTAAAATAIVLNSSNDPANLVIENSQITDNVGLLGGPSSNLGGGILLFAGSDAEITNSTVSGNTAGRGGGIHMQSGASDVSTAMIKNSTFSNNFAKQMGSSNGTGVAGGIDLFSGNLSIESSTISGNSANNVGGIVVTNDAAFTMHNSTVANNSSTTVGGLNILGTSKATIQNSILAGSIGALSDNCVANVMTASVSGDSNSIINGANNACGFGRNVDPQLSALASNGGPTFTHLISDSGPAESSGNPDACLANDQRGELRDSSGSLLFPIIVASSKAAVINLSGTCDVGAVEVEPAT